MLLQELLQPQVNPTLMAVLEIVKASGSVGIILLWFRSNTISRSLKETRTSVSGTLKSINTSVSNLSDSVRKVELWMAAHVPEFSGLTRKVEEIDAEQRELFKFSNSYSIEIRKEVESRYSELRREIDSLKQYHEKV